MMPDMTIWEAYEAYRIMPNLRLHQLRVAEDGAIPRQRKSFPHREARGVKAEHRQDQQRHVQKRVRAQRVEGKQRVD